MKDQYLFIFAQAHDDFRVPELYSVAELYGFDLVIPEDFDVARPFAVLELEKEEHARLLARRCVLIRSVYEFYARGSNYEELHVGNRAARPKWEKYIPDTSFKFVVNGYNQSVPQHRQKQVIEHFSYMDFLGKIDMKTPEIILGCFEEYRDTTGSIRQKHDDDGNFREVFFGRLVEEGSARPLVGKFNVKKRAYFGNTSMEAEVSLLMANQTLAAPGKLIYDPFVGTGSMLYTAAHFGALVFGSDIDGRQMRGKESRPGIIRAAIQYGVQQRVLDLCTFDVTHNPLRCGGIFDAIVTDPPYGVRAGAKRLGRKKRRIGSRPDDQPYIPPTKPYELSALARDLVLLARYLLKPQGRLVFFLPTVTEEYQEIDIQMMLCDGMEVAANSLQDFGAWGRRLVTIRRTTTFNYSSPTFDADGGDLGVNGEEHAPAHRDFREKYFQGFKREL
ncbi:tRNA guanosine-2'-O-methyltransferase [Vararia minispora EC-137]|uniref:tRNA guanosine-2'-O-methyltransferase n=1 Tax=Vararia minispora EC-137 TaxID=1314806 RepID=A0ACB8QGI7_9AGAM|nr:tRNA guanosine-2'-O-methyltransferase [Vararia minispora EC-137]